LILNFNRMIVVIGKQIPHMDSFPECHDSYAEINLNAL